MEPFKSFEEFEKYLENNVSECTEKNILKFQYQILFRRWDELKEDINNLDCYIDNFAKSPIMVDGDIKWVDSKFTIKNIIEWNAGYFNKSGIKEGIVTEINELGYYTESIDEGKSVFDIFFISNHPVLDIKYFEAQTRAAKIIKDETKPNFHLIFDEVGTGKTVSALYCIRDTVQVRHEESKILVTCPDNKKTEWQKDIKRQLGLYSHIVGNEYIKDVYKGDLKRIYFKDKEPMIFIKSQKNNENKSELDRWDELEKWDFIIIDEGHQCFDNYSTLRGNKALLLTATPIVVNSSTEDGITSISNVRRPIDYVNKLCDITETGRQYQLDNLFYDNDFFTQLFREDLDINPKNRRIVFERCKRMDKREYYLDVLTEVKGNMTRLIYEQDDDYLIYGISEKFKQEIEREGYIVDEKIENINYKYEEVKRYLAENGLKSYIIFFNTKWPADNIYEKLISDNNVSKNNVIIAKKYGGKICEVYPQINSVTANNFFDYLQGQIENGKRVILITTGASGGTGLNLGKFDGVINYELPFTSIELEQRFGRVDRMDESEVNEKELVFILNDDANPMLRYSILKINKTCEYMPIRNTILFYSDFINENIRSLRKEFENYVFNEFEKKQFKAYCKELNAIVDEDIELIKKLIAYIMKKGTIKGFEEDIDGISEGTEKFINKIISVNDTEIYKLYKVRDRLNILETEILNWCNLLGNEGDDSNIKSNSAYKDDNSAEFEEYELENDYVQSQEMLVEETKNELKKDKYLIDADMMIEIIDRLKLKLEKLDYLSCNQVATGLFYINNGKYCKQTVEEYRKTFLGEINND